MTQATDSPKPSWRQSFWKHAEKAACQLFRHGLRIKARDRTAQTETRPALVLAPHADDETLGCGGTIALKRKAGTAVTVAVATDGSASHSRERTLETSRDDLVQLRQRETTQACATLGVTSEHLHFLGFKDGQLSDCVPELSAAIAELIQNASPREVYVSAHRDGHPDHVALALAARRAVQDLPENTVSLYEYPVWSFDFRSWRRPGLTNTKGFLLGLRDMLSELARWQMSSVRIGSFVALKRTALDAHQSQLGTYQPEPHWSGLPESFLQNFFSPRELFRHVPRDQDGAR